MNFPSELELPLSLRCSFYSQHTNVQTAIVMTGHARCRFASKEPMDEHDKTTKFWL